MTATRHRIGRSLVDIQNAFLDTPGLALTFEEARMLFGLDHVTCAALLKTLTESGVLERTRAGAYVRHFPLSSAA
jgi:hypothetical protein